MKQSKAVLFLTGLTIIFLAAIFNTITILIYDLRF